MPARDPALTFTALWTLLTATVITSVTQPNLVSTSGVATVALAIFLMETQVVREAQSGESGSRVPSRRYQPLRAA